MTEPALYPRFAELRLAEALADSPAVLIHGPRQFGKTTLARVVGGRLGHAFVRLDDEVARGAWRKPRERAEHDDDLDTRRLIA
jgi:predicted AAA+ superfamily ATPase